MLEVSAGSLPRANKIHTDSVPGDGTKAEPKSRRHPYDFYVMMNQEFAKKAIKDDELNYGSPFVITERSPSVSGCHLPNSGHWICP